MIDLLQTGGFSDLPFGMPRDEFIGKVGDTDYFVFAFRRDRSPSLLRYGNVEFFITTDSHLLYGFWWEPTETEVPQGNHRLQIDPWIFRGGVSRSSVEQGLRDAKIAFTGSKSTDGVYALSLASGVSLTFFGDEEGENAGKLCAVSAVRLDLLPDQEPTKQVSMTLTVQEVERIKLDAARQGVSVANLCAAWIRQRLRSGEDTTETVASDTRQENQ